MINMVNFEERMKTIINAIYDKFIEGDIIIFKEMRMLIQKELGVSSKGTIKEYMEDLENWECIKKKHDLTWEVIPYEDVPDDFK